MSRIHCYLHQALVIYPSTVLPTGSLLAYKACPASLAFPSATVSTESGGSDCLLAVVCMYIALHLWVTVLSQYVTQSGIIGSGLSPVPFSWGLREDFLL